MIEPITPLDEPYFGVPAFLANGHGHGTLYISTYERTQYDQKTRENDSCLFYLKP